MLMLHPPTLQLIGIIVTLVSAGVSLLTWYRHRGGAGLRSWAMALLLGGAATFLYSMRGNDPSFRVVLFGDTLFVAGFVTMWLSMRRFNNPQLALGRMIVIAAAVTIIFGILFTLAWQAAAALRAHSIVFSLFICGLALAAARETWQGRRLDGLRSRGIAALALVGIAVARLMRALVVFGRATDMVDSQTNAIALGYTQYVTTVCILVVTFGLVLMANERFERQYAALAEGRPTT
ncbi:MAG: hypothetical protein FJX11_08775 [Alphaproteobacteria bacterium]|nr:hypothetical protein [Alphaproteobacteria bacterium]